jgi:hypothetical protein
MLSLIDFNTRTKHPCTAEAAAAFRIQHTAEIGDDGHPTREMMSLERKVGKGQM